jgi:hypothetical protein
MPTMSVAETLRTGRIAIWDARTACPVDRNPRRIELVYAASALPEKPENPLRLREFLRDVRRL